MMKRRILAIVLTLSIVLAFLPIMSISALNATDWTNTGNVSVTGDEVDGFKIVGDAYSTSSTVKTEDFSKHDVKFKMTLNENDKWGYIAITKTAAVDPSGMLPVASALDGLYLLLYKSVNDVTVMLWDGANTVEIFGKIENFDFAAEHTLGFDKVADKWHIAFDGITYNNGVDLTSYLSALVGCNNYYTFSASTGFTFDAVRFIDSNWVLTGSGISINGNVNDGYKISGGAYTTAANVTTKDFSKQDLKFKITLNENDKWGYIAITKTAAVDPSGMLPVASALDGLYLLLYKSVNDVTVMLWDGANTVEIFGKIENFDFAAEHTLGFDKVADKWHIAFDGITYNNGVDLTSYLSALVGCNNYYTFSASTGFTFDAVRFVSHSSGQLASAGNNNQGSGTEGGAGTEGGSNSQEGSQDEAKEGWVTSNESVKVKDLGDKAYKITGVPFLTASIYGHDDFSKNDISFELDLKETGKWAYVAITKNAAADVADLLPKTENLDGIYLLIEKQSDSSANLLFWTGDTKGGSTGYGTTLLASFNISGEHRLGFVDIDGKWYLRLDGVAYDESNGGVDLTEYVSKLKGTRNFYTLTAQTDYEFNNFKFVDSSVQPDLPPFNNIGFEVGGDSKTGYTLTGELGAAAVFRTPINLSTDSVQLKLGIEPADQWILLGFSTSMSNLGGLILKEEEAKAINALDFIITRKGDGTAEIARWDPASKLTQVIGTIKDFDWDKIHTFKFINTLDSWYIEVDGNAMYGMDLTQWVDPLVKGKTYVKLLAGCEKGNIQNFKVLNPNSPNTGDNTSSYLYVLLITFIFASILVITGILKKNSRVFSKN